MRLTAKQSIVLDELCKKCRANAYRYKGREPYLHGLDRDKLARGDRSCVFGLGGLTYQIGHTLGMTAGAVLSTFKSLERKGLVMRETSFPEYQRPLYWWPIGLAEILHYDLSVEESLQVTE